MKCLILGANGMAGHVMTLWLREAGHAVDVVARRTTVFTETLEMDLCHVPTVDALLRRGDYDVVINCAGVLIEACRASPLDAIAINSLLPQHLAAGLSGTETKLVHLSTDCVFSGEHGPYVEDAPFDGQRVYDRSKALGEVVNAKDLTVRMSIIGPELHEGGTGLFHWFMQQTGPIPGFSRARWNGITTVELARVTERLVTKGATGLVHVVPSGSVTKLELLRLLDCEFDRNLTIQPSDGHASDKRLVNTRTDLAHEVRNYAQQLGEMRAWIEAHPQLYGHYLGSQS